MRRPQQPRPPEAPRRSRAGPGGSVRAHKARHSPLALSEQRTRGFGSVDYVASLLGLACFCQAPDPGRVGENLGGLAHRKVLLDRDKNRLLHATVLDFSYLLELILHLRRQT